MTRPGQSWWDRCMAREMAVLHPGNSVLNRKQRSTPLSIPCSVPSVPYLDVSSTQSHAKVDGGFSVLLVMYSYAMSLEGTPLRVV